MNYRLKIAIVVTILMLSLWVGVMIGTLFLISTPPPPPPGLATAAIEETVRFGAEQWHIQLTEMARGKP